MSSKNNSRATTTRRTINPASSHHIHTNGSKQKVVKNQHPSGQKRTILFAIITAIVLFFGWFLFVSLIIPVFNAVTTPASQSIKPDFENSKSLTESAVNGIEGELLDIDTIRGVGGTTNGYVTYMSAPYKVEGASFYAMPLASSGIAFRSDSEQAEKDYALLKNFFIKNSFTHSYSDELIRRPAKWDGATLSILNQDSYTSDEFICLIQHADASNTPLAKHIVGIGCADRDSYAASSATLRPIYAAYVQESKSPSPSVVLGVISASISKNDYQYLITYQEDPSISNDYSLGLYYKSDKENVWHFFKSYQQQPVCEDFNTPSLKIAFSGLGCVTKDTSQQKSV